MLHDDLFVICVNCQVEKATIGEPLTATRKDGYRILRSFSPLLGWRNLYVTDQITQGFLQTSATPRVEKSADFSACFRGGSRVSKINITEC